MKWALLLIFFGIVSNSCGVKYSKIENQDVTNSEIVVINMGKRFRLALAKEIEIINSFNPKVVAIDAFFLGEKDNYSDSLLITALERCNNLVMPVLIEDYDSISQGGNQTLEIMSLPKFQCNATLGFVNAILENDGFDTQRYFMHSKTLGDSVIYHFAICAAMKYDSIRTFNFLNRSKMISEINYFGNDKAFKTFSDFDVFDGKLNREDIEGKIVLIGYMGPYPGFRHNNDDDKYFTPLNAKVPPYSPDMYGVIIHANIIAQALNR